MQAEAKLGLNDCSNVSFAVGDVEHCDYPNNSFDAILCSSAIFYVNLKAVGTKLHAWLRPGGILAYNSLEVGLIVI